MHIFAERCERPAIGGLCGTQQNSAAKHCAHQQPSNTLELWDGCEAHKWHQFSGGAGKNEWGPAAVANDWEYASQSGMHEFK